MSEKCLRCGVPFEWPYPRHINEICMECHREAGSFWGLMDELMEDSAVIAAAKKRQP